MADKNLNSGNDSLLIPFLSVETEVTAEDCLNLLFEETIIPQIGKVLASYLTLTSDDKDEIQSDALTRVLRKLRILRESYLSKTPFIKPIRNFPAFISTVAFNCRKDFILRQKPEWRRIDYRLKRLKDEETCEWHFFIDDDEKELVGLKEKSKMHSEIELEAIISRVKADYPKHWFLKEQKSVPIILEIADGALTKNELIRTILEITNTANSEEVEIPEEMSEYLKTDKNDELIAKRQNVFLRRVWDEIKTFPPTQRKVLLLSLKESRKVEAITLLLKKRIASIKEIADVLEVSLEEFSDIFERLPLTSREIREIFIDSFSHFLRRSRFRHRIKLFQKFIR